jgi:hypothetical protein
MVEAGEEREAAVMAGSARMVVAADSPARPVRASAGACSSWAARLASPSEAFLATRPSVVSAGLEEPEARAAPAVRPAREVPAGPAVVAAQAALGSSAARAVTAAREAPGVPVRSAALEGLAEPATAVRPAVLEREVRYSSPAEAFRFSTVQF